MKQTIMLKTKNYMEISSDHDSSDSLKKIAILYIAVGRYISFFDDFYRTSKQYLLKECDVTYFVFTDDAMASYQDCPDIICIPTEKKGWPYDTLCRFETFLKAEEQLKEYDYIYFINANMIFTAPIGKEIFPTQEQRWTVLLHPGFYKCSRKTFTYDENPQSCAYIPSDEGEYYFMGAFNGGIGKDYLELIRILDARTKEDLAKGIIALYHDESHLNRFMLDKSPLMLSPEYGFPEVIFNEEHLSPLQKSIKMLIKEKGLPKYGGKEWLRGSSNRKIKDSKGIWKNIRSFFKRH
ncbi:MAG: family 6 glucosyltransferase [Akkermansia sp.]